jgi:hypothetical protein
MTISEGNNEYDVLYWKCSTNGDSTNRCVALVLARGNAHANDSATIVPKGEADDFVVGGREYRVEPGTLLMVYRESSVIQQCPPDVAGIKAAASAFVRTFDDSTGDSR